MSAFDSTIDTEILPAIPDYSRSLVAQNNDSQGNDIAPQAMSPMDSLRAIFEDIRDGINTLVDLTTKMSPSAADLRDQGVSDADVPPPGADSDSQGNKGFNFEMPEVGPKLGLALMLVGLTALFKYSDQITAALVPVLKFADDFLEMLGPTGSLYLGLGLLASLIFPKTVTTLLGAGAKGIGFAFKELTTGFKGMRKFLGTTAPKKIGEAYGKGKDLFTKAFSLVRRAFTALRLFMVRTLAPTVTAFFAPILPAILPVVLAVAAVTAIFYSIKEGIDKFRESLAEGDSMLVAITEGVSTALLTLITLPVTLMVKAAAFIAEKLGFENVAEKLKELDIVEFIKDGVKTLVLKAKDFVLGLFDIDFQAILGKFTDIGGALILRIKAIGAGALAATKAVAPFGDTPVEAFKKAYDEYMRNNRPKAPVESLMTQDDVLELSSDETLKKNESILKEGLENSLDKQETIAEMYGRNSPEYKAEVMRFNAIDNKLSEVEKEQMDRETSSSVTTVIQDNKQVTNSTQNTTEQTPGLAATENDYTAKALSAFASGRYAGGF
jgi:hypothetical protein